MGRELRSTRTAMALLGGAILLQLVSLHQLRGAEITVDPTSTITYAAVARLPSSGSWRYLADGSHVKSGFTAIRCDATSGALFMYYEPLESVASVWVSPDETLARRGILAGASVTRDHWRILFTRITSDGPRAVSCGNQILRGDAANVWVGLVAVPTSESAGTESSGSPKREAVPA